MYIHENKYLLRPMVWSIWRISKSINLSRSCLYFLQSLMIFYNIQSLNKKKEELFYDTEEDEEKRQQRESSNTAETVNGCTIFCILSFQLKSIYESVAKTLSFMYKYICLPFQHLKRCKLTNWVRSVIFGFAKEWYKLTD